MGYETGFPGKTGPVSDAEGIHFPLENAMSAYGAVMGTLLLIPWALIGVGMVGTALSSVAVSRRRSHPKALPSASSLESGRVPQDQSFAN